jgi:hypothetical protein
MANVDSRPKSTFALAIIVFVGLIVARNDPGLNSKD